MRPHRNPPKVARFKPSSGDLEAKSAKAHARRLEREDEERRRRAAIIHDTLIIAHNSVPVMNELDEREMMDSPPRKRLKRRAVVVVEESDNEDERVEEEDGTIVADSVDEDDDDDDNEQSHGSVDDNGERGRESIADGNDVAAVDNVESGTSSSEEGEVGPTLAEREERMLQLLVDTQLRPTDVIATGQNLFRRRREVRLRTSNDILYEYDEHPCIVSLGNHTRENRLALRTLDAPTPTSVLIRLVPSGVRQWLELTNRSEFVPLTSVFSDPAPDRLAYALIDHVWTPVIVHNHSEQGRKLVELLRRNAIISELTFTMVDEMEDIMYLPRDHVQVSGLAVPELVPPPPPPPPPPSPSSSSSSSNLSDFIEDDTAPVAYYDGLPAAEKAVDQVRNKDLINIIKEHDRGQPVVEDANRQLISADDFIWPVKGSISQSHLDKAIATLRVSTNSEQYHRHMRPSPDFVLLMHTQLELWRLSATNLHFYTHHFYPKAATSCVLSIGASNRNEQVMPQMMQRVANLVLVRDPAHDETNGKCHVCLIANRCNNLFAFAAVEGEKATLLLAGACCASRISASMGAFSALLAAASVWQTLVSEPQRARVYHHVIKALDQCDRAYHRNENMRT